MVKQINPSRQNGEERVQNKQEPGNENIRVNSMISVEATNQKAAIALTESQSSFLKDDMKSMGEGKSVVPFTDTSASGSNDASEEIRISPEQGDGSVVPPQDIIQQLDDDPEQLINLDSIQDSERESDASDLKGTSTKGDDNKSALLDVDSSSTSQGSQGSYAHQVPALLGSHGSNAIDIDHLPNENLSPPQHPSLTKAMSRQNQSVHSRSSHLRDLEKPQNSNLDDILGPKGEPIKCDLGSEGVPTHSSLDDILGPQINGKPSNLDDTLGPYEGSAISPSSVPQEGHPSTAPKQPTLGRNSIPSSKNTPSASNRAANEIGVPKISIDNDSTAFDAAHESTEASSAFDTAYESSVAAEPKPNSFISKPTAFGSMFAKQKPPVYAQEIVSMQLNHNPRSKDFVESKSTLESKETGLSQTTRSSVGFTSESSREDTFDQGGDTTTLGDDTFGRNQSSTWDSTLGGTFSPNRSPDMSRTADLTFSNSRRDSFRGDSMQSLDSSGGSALNQTDSRIQVNQSSSVESSQLRMTSNSQLSPTNEIASRRRNREFDTEDSSYSSYVKHSEYSDTDYTSGSQYTFANSTSAIGSRSRRNEFDSSPTKHSNFSHTEHTRGTTNAICSINGSDNGNDSTSGRMRRDTPLQAGNNDGRQLSPRAKKFAESIMARTRSRAEPNALLNSSSNIETIEKPTRSMININAQEEGGFIESTAIARKRGRVIQLLAIGLLSFLISFLGGLLVLSSCYFLSAPIQLGDDGEEVDLHFGLWKYSPAYSASQGYTYCINYSYEGEFVVDAPWFGRISSLIALSGGAFSLGVLWLYLVLGRYVNNIWNIAVYAAAISGILQLSTLSVLAGTICNERTCSLGPAGVISIVAGIFYFVLAFEMHKNTPLDDKATNISSGDETHHVTSNLEMSDFPKYVPPSAIV
jgi:hypothetical protein